MSGAIPDGFVVDCQLLNNYELARKYNRHPDTIIKWRRIVGIKSPAKLRPDEETGTPPDEDVGLLKARLETYEARISNITCPYPSNRTHDHSEFYKGSTLKIALLSDTHLGSRLERLGDLQTAYRMMENEGVEACYHAGDLIAGQSVYRGQENELKVWGFDEQVDYFANNYPLSKGFKTYFITGNHCLSFLVKTGADPGLRIAALRSDMVYLDQMTADVLLTDGVVLRLWHGGGPAYSRSYKLQKYIDSLEGGDKPNILASGHTHNDFFMNYRNIAAFNVGCFERQTLFLKRLGLQPSCSFWLVDLHIKEGSLNRIKTELVKFF